MSRSSRKSMHKIDWRCYARKAAGSMEQYMTRSLRVVLLAALMAAPLWGAAAQPQNYPTRAIIIVVPFAGIALAMRTQPATA